MWFDLLSTHTATHMHNQSTITSIQHTIPSLCCSTWTVSVCMSLSLWFKKRSWGLSRGVNHLCHLTCVFAAVHLQMRQFEVFLAAARIRTYELTLLIGLWRPPNGGSNASYPSDILQEKENTKMGLNCVHLFIVSQFLCPCMHVNWPVVLWRRCVCVCGTGHSRAWVEVGLGLWGHCRSWLCGLRWAEAKWQID